MGEDEGAVQVNRLLVVLSSFSELSKNEVKLGAVVVDIRIVLVLSDGELKVIDSAFLIACSRLVSSRRATNLDSLPNSRCKLARLM